ncbi:hypothetical protein [Paraburkholderia sp. GAS334]|uniref:hypothetical protein n=1 Tax=Paraburkholderia sp. GAS334 TaxID=3035131 RepID=UPI003D22D4D9
MMNNVPRAPIKSATGYFRTIEMLDRLYRVRRQRRSRTDEEPTNMALLDLVHFDGKLEGSQEDALLETLEKRIFSYLDSLSDDKRDQLRKSSRKHTHRGLLDEYEDRKVQDAWRKGRWPGDNLSQWQIERGRSIGQKWSTHLILDCMPTTDRASELLARQQRVNRFLSWAAEPAGDPETEAERIAAFVEAVWHAQSGYRQIVGLDAHQMAFQQLRQRHFFPDLIELIGAPAPDHHDADGTLTTERKRQLLLLGTFPWRGMLLTYERLWSRDGWWLKHGFQWRVATSCRCPRTRAFPTLADVLPQPHAYEWEDFTKACQAWGIKKETKTGKGLPRTRRQLQCEHCLNWVFSDASKRLSLAGIRGRYCLSCYQTLRMARALKVLEQKKKPSTSLNGRKKFWE